MSVSLAAQLLTVSIISLQRQLYHNRGLNRTSWNDSYDFIVVGGGTAGCIVAGRLTENPNVSVLLLEAGGPLTITSDIIPTFYWYDNSWNYRTVPQKYAGFGLNNRQVITPRGKILGGSHAINIAAYTRGNQHDYDSWANDYGARGWSFREVLPYFLRSENNTDPAVVAAAPEFHSTSGPIQISTSPHRDPIEDKWVAAAHRLGWPISDYGNPTAQYGVTILQQTVSNQNWTRQTTAAGFIEVNIGRPNLHVLLRSHVTRILFNNTGGSGTPTATGVEFVHGNRTYQVSARREVISSAGAINGPQLLMLSGIGPRDQLAQFGISQIAEVPGVGENLREHSMIIHDFTVTNQSDITWSSNLYFNLNVQNLYDYYTSASGPLTRIHATETYVGSGINGDRDWPDGNSYILINQASPSAESLQYIYDQNNQEAWLEYNRQFENNNRHFWIPHILMRPRSTGTIRLASADPFTAPLIDPAYFSNRIDLAAIVQIMRTTLRIAESPELAPLMKYSALPIPGCTFCPDKPLSECTSYLICSAVTYTQTTFHPAGSCAMGNSSNPLAVVDERLRVRAVRNLRIIDASIMPQIPNCNINAPTMMIGEHGAEIIKQDYGLNM